MPVGEHYCAIPTRAMADDRLSASHFKLLLAIAWRACDPEAPRQVGAWCAKQSTGRSSTGNVDADLT